MKQQHEKTASEFWKACAEYPDYQHIKNRRLYELNYLVPKLKDVNKLLDLGCGTGDLIVALHSLIDIEQYYAYDFSSKLLDNLRHHNFKDTIIEEVDIVKIKSLPETDVTISSGVFSYIFEDETLKTVLKKINSSILYLRIPCSIEKSSICINSFSEALGSQYSSFYRTVEHMLNILKVVGYRVHAINRVYPDEIESKFATRQYYFECRK